MKISINGPDHRYLWNDRDETVRVYRKPSGLVEEWTGIGSYCQFVEATMKFEGE